ncbi:hypothetical protein ACHAPZ_011204 [Fusarium culmorum]
MISFLTVARYAAVVLVCALRWGLARELRAYFGLTIVVSQDDPAYGWAMAIELALVAACCFVCFQIEVTTSGLSNSRV